MAPLPPNSTARFKVFYSNSGEQHVQEYRSAASPASFNSELEAIWDDVSPLMKLTTIDDVQWAASGSNVFNSVVMGITGNTYGSGAGSVDYIPLFISFIGRSSDGRRVRLYFFGAVLTGADFRIVAGENADVDAVINTLDTSSVVTIGGLAPVWKSYANAGYSAYWQRKVRA